MSFGGLGRVSGAGGAVAGTGTGYDYVVDSVNGNDANSGVPGEPFRTIDALETAIGSQSDLRIGLAKGSTWREKLTLGASNNSIVLEAYGSGNDPFICCDDVITAENWTLTAGRTAVFQASLTVDPDANAAEWPGAWCDDARLTFSETDLTANEGIAGTFWYDANTIQNDSSITLYIHAPGSSDPRSDGKTYEASIRRSGIDAYAAQNCVINGVTARRNYGSYGSITVGRNGLAINCTVLEGNTHNMLLRAGSRAINCHAIDSYDASATGLIVFIAYEPTPDAGSSISFEGCSASATNAIWGKGNAFYAHTNGVASFAAISFVGCTSTNFDVAFSAANTDVLNITRGSATGYIQAIKPAAAVTHISGMVLGAAQVGGQILVVDIDNSVVNIDNMTAAPNTSGQIQSGKIGTTVNLTNSEISACNTFVRGSAANQVWNISGTTFPPAGRGGAIYHLTGAAFTLTSDFNNFGGNTTGLFILGGTTYPNFTDYRTATGQDVNSVN